MKNKKLYAVLCFTGSFMVGWFSSQLSTTAGCILFGIGVGLSVFAMTNLSK